MALLWVPPRRCYVSSLSFLLPKTTPVLTCELQVNGEKITPRRLLRHGDEISLGHMGTLENHDVRYIFRSVGTKGSKYGKTVSQEGMAPVGEVYERYQILER